MESVFVFEREDSFLTVFLIAFKEALVWNARVLSRASSVSADTVSLQLTLVR